MTIDEIEKQYCSKCSNNGHWGWCDAPWIKCGHKTQIKEILGVEGSNYKTITEQMKDLGIEVEDGNDDW